MASEVTFAPATVALARELAADMCPEDEAEVVAGGQPDGLSALLFSLRVSEVAVAMLVDGRVAAMFGIQPLEATTHLGQLQRGLVWALTSRVSRKHPRAYMEHSRAVVKALLSYCPDLSNYIDARHRQALRWARWMGFELGAPVPLGPQGLPFIPFRARA